MTLDFSARYTVDGYRGIAFYLVGYAKLSTDCYENEPEDDDDESMVIAVMVGDDRHHIVDVDDLTVLEDSEYCSECGQVGCKATVS